MSDPKNGTKLAMVFALLSKAAKRKKIYAHKAAKKERPEVAHFLRAMSASESAQASRLFNSMIGKVDRSDDYLATVFEQEVQDIIASYSDIIDNGLAERPALLQAINQLRTAEIRLGSFYSPAKQDVKVEKDAQYFVCHFCGYLSTDTPPEKCPVCSAPAAAFEKIF